ncbi:MAG: serine hydrolase domain-containing protein [Candidatus Aminicenantes bacterium]
MKKFIHAISVFLFIFWLIPLTPLAQESRPEAGETEQEIYPPSGLIDPDELETFIDGIMSAHMASHHIAGAAFSLVKDGEIFFAKGYGYADVEKKKPVEADKTLFRPGSASKLFTWTAVMQLFEQGKLDLNTDVNTYLEDFKIPETYPDSITLTHLLTHTPGFEDVWTGMSARTAEDLESLGEFLANHMPARIYPPGKITAYSNYGTALAGYIVEIASGMPFQQYVEENIYKPLDMNMSTFRQPLPEKLADHMSKGYIHKNGLFKAKDFWLINGMAPAGSMSTTATDMAKFMIAHLQNGKYGEKRILKEETAKLMHSQLFSADSRLDGNAHGFWERTQNNLRMIGHGGDTRYFHTDLMLIPGKNVGLFVSYNSQGGAGTPREELLQAFLDRYYPVPEVPEPEPPADFKKRAGRYTGSYGMTRSVFTTYEKVANLFSAFKFKATDEGTLLLPLPKELGGGKQWVEVEPLVFHELDGQDILLFKEDAEGHITHAYLNQIPYFAFYKLKWYQAPVFHYILLAVCVILFLSTLGWPIGALYRVVCRRRKEKRDEPKTARWLAGSMSMLNVLFLIGLVATLSDPMQVSYGVPTLLKVFLVIPIISIVLGVGTLIFTIFAWKNRYWLGCARVHYTLVLLAAAVFMWFLYYWNLLGFQF